MMKDTGEIPMKQKIIMGKGKAYSRVSMEVENNLKNWLAATPVEEKDFLDAVEEESFSLSMHSDNEKAQIILYNDRGYIIAPLVWVKGNGVTYKEFQMDAGLLLFTVVGKCKKEESKRKIREFIRAELLQK